MLCIGRLGRCARWLARRSPRRKFAAATVECPSMSERIMADAAPAAATPRQRRGSFLGRALRWFVLLTVVLPVALLLIARFIPPRVTPLMISTLVFDGPIDQR